VKVGSEESNNNYKGIQCHKYKQLQRHLEERAKLRQIETIIATNLLELEIKFA